MHAGAGGVQRQPHDAVRHLGDRQRQCDLTPVGADGDQIAVGSADLALRWPPTAARRAGERFRRDGFAVLQPARVEQHPPTGEHRLTRIRALRTLAATPAGRSGRVPPHSPRRASSSPAAGAFGRREVDADLVGQEVKHPQVRDWRWCCRAGSNGRIRPSQLTNEPAFSTTGATGNTTSARSVTALSRSSRLTTNGAASTAARAASGSGRSASSTPPISSAPSSPSRCRGQNGCGVAAVGGRAARRRSRRRRSARAPTRRPAGGRRATGRAAHRLPRRRVRRPVAAPTPTGAPVARPICLPPRSAPGEPASRSPTRISAPGEFQLCVVGQAVQRGGLGAGRALDQPARHLGQPARRERRDRHHLQRVLAGRLAQPQVHDRRFLFGLEAHQQDRRRAVQVRVGDRHRLARDVRGEERGLLVAVLPRRGSRCRWCPTLSARTSSRRRRPRRWTVRRPGPRRCRSRPPARHPRRRGLPTRTPAGACRRRRESAEW